ncbi:hypothetical protein JHK84_044784 [Glycine max]|nr:hypothetical protein JHK86_044673 [Glycine max]KAG4951414.1 hypothetical protein JHK85_045281 [Glycine max]KAG5107877.1 hypothetical protein JHK84_044784 [Glycine max]
MKAFDVLNFAFKYRVGKEDISIFYSHWLDEGTICHELDYVHIFDTQLRIRNVLELVTHLVSTKNWNWVWKLNLPENIKYFAWLTLQKPHLSFDPFCCSCGLEEENIVHLLRDCTRSKQIWVHLGLDKFSTFYSVDAENWFKN